MNINEISRDGLLRLTGEVWMLGDEGGECDTVVWITVYFR